MLSLGRVAVDRSRFPEVHSPNSAGQVSGQSLGRVAGTTDSELDLLVDLAGKAPGLILRPDELRFLCDALCRAVPSHSWCVSECFDLSASTGPVKSSIARLGISTRGA